MHNCTSNGDNPTCPLPFIVRSRLGATRSSGDDSVLTSLPCNSLYPSPSILPFLCLLFGRLLAWAWGCRMEEANGDVIPHLHLLLSPSFFHEFCWDLFPHSDLWVVDWNMMTFWSTHALLAFLGICLSSETDEVLRLYGLQEISFFSQPARSHHSLLVNRSS